MLEKAVELGSGEVELLLSLDVAELVTESEVLRTTGFQSNGAATER